LTAEERNLVKGFIINKFRGDVSLLKPGLDFLEQRTGIPVLGVIPYFSNIGIAQEDSVYLDEKPQASPGNGLNIAIIRLPHIANYDDFDPLEDQDCRVSFINRPSEMIDPDLIILPGTKSTIPDFLYLRQQGLDRAIINQAKSGTPIIGICGGYQMLGKVIADPSGIESQESSIEGLGLLDTRTIFNPTKTTTQVKARIAAGKGLLKGLEGQEISGYEIHMGQTENPNLEPCFEILETPAGGVHNADGAISESGLIFGSYLHGLFHNTGFTQALLSHLRELRGLPASTGTLKDKDKQYDELAKIVRQNLDIRRIYETAFGRKRGGRP
jgi:adenosylcobyric acid synthase